jgi:hypothetical protein
VGIYFVLWEISKEGLLFEKKEAKIFDYWRARCRRRARQ